MFTPKKLIDNLNAITIKQKEISNKIGIVIKKISITENEHANQHGEYIDPYSIIIDVDSVAIPKESGSEFDNFEKYLRDILRPGIDILYEHILVNIHKQTNDPSIQHLLDSAIDITKVDPTKSWQEQFIEARSRKLPSQEVITTEEKDSEQQSGVKHDSPLRRQEQRNEIFTAIISLVCPQMSEERIRELTLSATDEFKSEIAINANLELLKTGKRSIDNPPSVDPKRMASEHRTTQSLVTKSQITGVPGQ
jgi:hypothetical protein